MTGRARAAGFTLLEMIIVLVVLALVAGMVMGRGPMHSATLDERVLVTKLVQTLRLARGAAIATNLPVVVAVDPEKRSLTVQGNAPVLLPPDMTVTASAGIDTPPAAKLTGIRFLPNGSSSGGRIVLASTRHKVTLGVDWLTGKVSVSDAP